MDNRPRSQLTSLGQIISKSMDEGFLGLAREMVRVFDVWEDAVGSYNASKAVPESVKNGRLTVLVGSSVWIDRLGYLKADFIKNINEALGAPMINDIIFRVGSIEARRKLKSDGHSGSARREPGPKPINQSIISAVSSVKDRELKEQLTALLARQRDARKE